jgi:hypothetical protein
LAPSRVATDETAINAQLAGIELNDLWDVAARFAARLRAIGIANPLPSSAPIRGSSCERFNIVLERVGAGAARHTLHRARGGYARSQETARVKLRQA